MARDRAAIRSQQEVADEIRDFSPNDWMRLEKIAKKYAGRHIEWQDLQQTALCRALEADQAGRNCPLDIDLMSFLAGVMRSISDAALQRAKRLPRNVTYTDDDRPQAEHLSNVALDPEERLVREQDAVTIHRHVLSLFDDDPVAKAIVEGVGNEKSARELRILTRLDEDSFGHKRRKIRRRIDKAYPNGWRR